jgi:nitrate reductase NapE
MSELDTLNAPSTKEEERNSFLFLVVLLAPILSFTLIGGYGFAVWIMQLIFGPPVS